MGWGERRPQVKNFRPRCSQSVLNCYRSWIQSSTQRPWTLKLSFSEIFAILWSKGKHPIFEGCIQLHHDTPGNKDWKQKHVGWKFGSWRVYDFIFIRWALEWCLSKWRTSESQRFGLWNLFQSDLWPHVFSIPAQFDIGSCLWPESGRCGLGSYQIALYIVFFSPFVWVFVFLCLVVSLLFSPLLIVSVCAVFERGGTSDDSWAPQMHHREPERILFFATCSSWRIKPYVFRGTNNLNTEKSHSLEASAWVFA